jgi:hypothetical protein
MRRPGGRGLLPGVVAQIKRHGAMRHSSARPGRCPDISRILATARGFLEPCRGHNVGPPVIFRGLAGSSPRTVGHQNPGASGSVNRLLRPDSVRHMSVTTAIQGLTTAHHDTQRDSSKAAREPGYAPVTGCFRWWWQVQGSNLRRLSRRFYSPLAPPESPPADQRIRRSRCVCGPPPSAMRPWATGFGDRAVREPWRNRPRTGADQPTDEHGPAHGRGGKGHGRGRWERLCRPLPSGFPL